MFQVTDIEADVRRVLGGCSNEEFYARVNSAVEILASESNWNPMLGYMDVCVCGDRYVTLPRQVGTVLSVTINGTPALGHDRFFKFHLNGPGCEFQTTGFHWVDGMEVATFREPPRAGSLLGVSIESSDDNGKEFRVYGYDVEGNWIRSVDSAGVLADGWPLPVAYGSVLPGNSAPAFRKIVRIRKAHMAGVARLYTVNATGQTFTFLGEYYPHETNPSYRRIQISTPGAWVRVAFKKNLELLSRPDDLIPLHSKYAVVLMVKSLRKMDEDRIEESEAYHNKAVSLLMKTQLAAEPPTGPSIQMADGNLIADKGDRMD